jgi:plasmid maintenance system antidote protein VapI
MKAKTKRKPTHPGELLREETLPAAGLTPSELAARLGVSQRGINALLNERRAVTPDILGDVLSYDIVNRLPPNTLLTPNPPSDASYATS